MQNVLCYPMKVVYNPVNNKVIQSVCLVYLYVIYGVYFDKQGRILKLSWRLLYTTVTTRDGRIVSVGDSVTGQHGSVRQVP